MKKINLTALVLAGSLLTACTVQGAGAPRLENNTGGSNTAAASLKIAHPAGETEVAVGPAKVVVFEYGILDMLDTLKIEVAGLPQSQLPASLEKYRTEKYLNTGTLQEPDFEKLAQLDPDLIIIGTRTQAAYEELSKLAPTVLLTIDPKDYLGSMAQNAGTLGKIFGKETEFQQKMAQIADQAPAIKVKLTALNETALILLANDGALSAYGADSRFGLIHDLGLTPIDEAIADSTHGQNVSFEFVLEKDPDHLFIVDRSKVAGGSNSADQMFDNPLIAKTKASKSGNIHYLDPFNWYIAAGGFSSTNSMLNELDKAIR